jgi:hypothetical protein
MTLEIRSVIHFLWMEGRFNGEITARIHARYGEDSISLRSIQNKTRHFASGDHTLEDGPWAGRSRSTEYVDEIRRLLEDNPFISQKKIEKTLNLHPVRVKHILVKNLSLAKVNFKWIPHLLNEAQNAERIRFSLELLKFLETRTKRQLLHVYTADETWIYHDKSRFAIWAGVDTQRPTRIRSSIGAKELMIWTCFSHFGIANVVHLPSQDNFTRAFFVEKILDGFDKALAHSCASLHASGAFLHLDKCHRDPATACLF